MAIAVCPQCGTKNRIDESAATMLQPVCGKCGARLEGGAETATSHPVTVTDSTFASSVLGVAGRPVLLDCWAEWCGPCRMIAPLLDQIAAESGGRYTIAKLNVDENPQTAAQFGIRSIPTMLIFKNGQLVDRIVGAVPKKAIEDRLAAHA